MRIIQRAVIFLGLGLCCGISQANDGDLDPTFGMDGVAHTGMAKTRLGAVVTRPDGKILACGRHAQGLQGYGFIVAQFLENGTLDPAFGVGGLAQVDFDAGYSSSCSGLVIQPDGRIVLVGTASTPSFPASTYTRAVAARLISNGTADTTFGDGSGRVMFTNSNVASAVALQNDGKIVIAGYVVLNSGQPPTTDFTVTRVLANGSLDPDFGTGGRVTTAFFPPPSHDIALNVAIDADHRIVVAGTANIYGPTQIAVLRVLTNGEFDSAFGTDGRVLVGGDDQHKVSGGGMIIQRDGNIVLSGTRAAYNPIHYDAFIARLVDDGSLDIAFANQGIATLELGPAATPWSSGSYALALQDDAKLISTGSASDKNNKAFATVTRLDSEGRVDTSFASNGSLAIDFADSDRPGQEFLAAVMSGGHVLAIGDMYGNSSSVGSTDVLVRLQSDLIFANGF